MRIDAPSYAETEVILALLLGNTSRARAVPMRSPCCSGGRPAGYRALNELPDARRRKRECVDLNAEIAQGGCDSVCNDASGRNDAAFAGALCTQRIVWRRVVLRCDGANAWKVGGYRQEIIGQRSNQKL